MCMKQYKLSTFAVYRLKVFVVVLLHSRVIVSFLLFII